MKGGGVKGYTLSKGTTASDTAHAWRTGMAKGEGETGEEGAGVQSAAGVSRLRQKFYFIPGAMEVTAMF